MMATGRECHRDGVPHGKAPDSEVFAAPLADNLDDRVVALLNTRSPMQQLC